jgi:hypothetical protein
MDPSHRSVILGLLASIRASVASLKTLLEGSDGVKERGTIRMTIQQEPLDGAAFGFELL